MSQLHPGDYDEVTHKRVQDAGNARPDRCDFWLCWNSPSTWRRVRYLGAPQYCWEAYGAVTYSPGKPPVDGHPGPVTPSGRHARLCDCGALKAKTTHALWCQTQPY